MEIQKKKRPASITIIGWSFIILAVFTLISGGLGILSLAHMRMQIPEGFELSPPELMPPSASFLFKNFELLVIVQSVTSIFVLIASIDFLRLHAWARTALEIVSWLGVLSSIALIGFVVVVWMGISEMFTRCQGNLDPSPLLGFFGLLAGAILLALYIIPLIVIIKVLRSNTVRAAVK